MTYAVSAASRAEVALQIVRTAPVDRVGAASPAAAPRSPDPRTGLSLPAGAGDAILSLVHARTQAQVRTPDGQGTAPGEARAEAEAQASTGGSASAEGHGWSSNAGEAAGQGSAAPGQAGQPADRAAWTPPSGDTGHSQTTVTISVETFSITVQRPPEDGRWIDNVWKIVRWRPISVLRELD